MFWRCPKCALPLSNNSAALFCDNAHNYDRAKQGYVNLLLANQKNSSEPGDNERMILARQQFLRSGYYSPLLDKILFLIQTYALKTKCDSLKIVDLGCGEGYYLETLLKSIFDEHSGPKFYFGYGVDISKVAVRKAAAASKKILSHGSMDHHLQLEYAIASNVNLPILDACADVVLTVFAPIVYSEVKRVLGSTGVFIRVSPGPKHLYALRSMLYDDVQLHEKLKIENGFELLEETSVEYDLMLNSSEAIEQLLEMTPFAWSGKEATKQRLIEAAYFKVEADFLIQVCKLHQ